MTPGFLAPKKFCVISNFSLWCSLCGLQKHPDFLHTHQKLVKETNMPKFDIFFGEKFSFPIQNLLQLELSKGGDIKVPASPKQLLACSPSLPSFQLHPGLISRGTNTSWIRCMGQTLSRPLPAPFFSDLYILLGRRECYFPTCTDLACSTCCV